MTTIVSTITQNTNCSLSILDTTGFNNGTTITTGFLPESDSSALALNTYKLSQGYFLNIIFYNKYAVTPIILNPIEPITNVVSVDSTYSNNFTAKFYSLVLDGSYTVTRYFIPSLTFYTANSSNAIYTDITQFYTDGTTIYKVISGTPTAISISTFATTSLTNTNCISSNVSFLSTCYMNLCYFRLLSTITDHNIGLQHYRSSDNYRQDYGDTYYDSYRNSRSEDDKRFIVEEFKEKRDIIYMTLEVIKYLQDVNNITQIQKLIESIDICGIICPPIISSTSSNCGCNG